MNRGDVYYVNFGPSIGGEIKKMRPAVIVSNDAANKYLNRVQAIPLTSQINKLYPSEAYVTIGNKKNKAMADQIATVSKKRLLRKIGKLLTRDMQKVEHAIIIHLDLH